MSQQDIGIVGGGPWGVALAAASRRGGSRVTLFSRRDHAQPLGDVRMTHDLARVAEARLIVLAVPSVAARAVARALGDHLDGGHLVVHGVRGLGSDRLETLSEILRDETPARRLGALGGPVQAAELRDGEPSAMVCGSRYPEVLAAVKSAFESPSLKVYFTHDLRGLEWASALVGCLSIAIGFAKQSGAGPGLVAALISRAMDEAARIAVAAGAEERTMLGLGGYGDLLASMALEDRPEVIVGQALGRGLSLQEATAQAQLRVEAIDLLPRVVGFARAHGVKAGIFEALADMLAGADVGSVIARMFAA